LIKAAGRGAEFFFHDAAEAMLLPAGCNLKKKEENMPVRTAMRVMSVKIKLNIY